MPHSGVPALPPQSVAFSAWGVCPSSSSQNPNQAGYETEGATWGLLVVLGGLNSTREQGPAWKELKAHRRDSVLKACHISFNAIKTSEDFL